MLKAVPALQLRELGLREVKTIYPSHTAKHWGKIEQWLEPSSSASCFFLWPPIQLVSEGQILSPDLWDWRTPGTWHWTDEIKSSLLVTSTHSPEEREHCAMRGHPGVALGNRVNHRGCGRQALWYQYSGVAPESSGRVWSASLNNSWGWWETETCYSALSKNYTWSV